MNMNVSSPFILAATGSLRSPTHLVALPPPLLFRLLSPHKLPVIGVRMVPRSQPSQRIDLLLKRRGGEVHLTLPGDGVLVVDVLLGLRRAKKVRRG